MNNDRDDRIDPVTGAPVHEPLPSRDSPRGWIGWLAAALLALLVIVLLVRGCEAVDENQSADVAPAGAGQVSDAIDPMAPAAAYSTADFDAYLAGAEPVGRAFSLDRVTFASGSDALDATGQAEIAELAGVLRRYPNAAVALTGFADPEGDAAANQALSQRRAEAVRAALASAGAGAEAVSIAAVGETGTAAVRANRKVEVRVTAR